MFHPDKYDNKKYFTEEKNYETQIYICNAYKSLIESNFLL